MAALAARTSRAGSKRRRSVGEREGTAERRSTMNDVTKGAAPRGPGAVASGLALALGIVTGCASAPPPELKDARAEYARASTGPAAQLAPDDVRMAKAALDDAEVAYRENGDSEDTRDRATDAQRRAQLAEAHARVTAENRERAEERREVSLTSAQVAMQQRQAAVEAAAIQAEDRARDEDEHRMALAALDLAPIATVRREARGVVITIPASTLFAPGKAALLNSAADKMAKVSQTLGTFDTDATIRVEGFTDAQGNPTFNQDLSRKRADAVRAYLGAHGVASDRILAEGFGGERPIADDANPGGRADNRRVEIVVEPTKPVPGNAKQ
jgi:outer membrane protein OmpA-like peptidoglycan-associated protein